MPVFPGDDLPELKEHIDLENDIVHCSIKTGMHVGTHIDGPLHMIPNGRKLSDISIDKFVAGGHLIDARGKKEIGSSLLLDKKIKKGDCVLAYTGYDKKFKTSEFYTNYPVISEDLAKKLVDLKVKFVGMDTPGPDNAPFNIHIILLKEEILIIEAMNNLFSLLDVKKFEVIALPINFEAEGSPVRVIARY